MTVLGSIIELVLGTFIVLLFVRLIVDWIQMFARSWTPRGPVLVILEGVYTVTDPPVKALRKVIPPLRLGGVAIDLSSWPSCSSATSCSRSTGSYCCS